MTRALIDDLSVRLPVEAKVLVVSHKDTEHFVVSYDTPFELKTGHWGAIDGLNDYQDCDTFVCFGLPYRDRIMASNIYFAINGPQANDWLTDPERRADHGYSDIQAAIMEGVVAADVIQAINRIRVRRVIDAEGNCESADCYILLGKDRLSDNLLEHIKRAMPGITVREWLAAWDHTNDKAKAPRNYHRSKFADSLCKFLEGKGGGQWAASQLRSQLNMSAEDWKELARQLRDESTILFKKISSLGCTYVSEGKGRASRSYILKDA